MKFKVLGLFLLFITSKVIAQEEENIKRINKRGSLFDEEYYVLADNKKIKQGRYTKYRVLPNGVQLIETGNYKDNLKDGEWIYFYDLNANIVKLQGCIGNMSLILPSNKEILNPISSKGNYVYGKKNGIWATYYMDTLSTADFQYSLNKKGKIDGTQIGIDQSGGKLQSIGMYRNDKRVGLWSFYDYNGQLLKKANLTTYKLFYDSTLKDSTTYNINRNPVYIGTEDNLVKGLRYELSEKVLGLNTMNAKKDSADVSFVIAIDGTIEETQVINSTYPKTQNDELLRFVKQTGGGWLPGMTNGVVVPKIYKLRILTEAIPAKNEGRMVQVNYIAKVEILTQ